MGVDIPEEQAVAFEKRDPGAEAPRDVVMSVCGEIAQGFASQGFILRKTRPALRRTEGDLVFEVGFQSNRHNEAGRYVGVMAHAGVASYRFGEWQRRNPRPWRPSMPGPAGIAGGQLGNLREPPRWMEWWDFADPASRPARVADAISAIREIALPFFARCSDPLEMIAQARREGQRAIELAVGFASREIELALCFGSREVAEDMARGFLASHPEIENDFRLACETYRREGGPRFVGQGWAKSLAGQVVANELNV